MQFLAQGDGLHFRRWWVEGAHGVVVISHGLGEHSGRYRSLAQRLNQAGYSVYAPDHFGHGQSAGKRGHIDDFARYSGHLGEFIGMVRRDNPDKPLHLLGHSMGGVIACGCVIRYGGVDSLILSAPAFLGASEPVGLERAVLLMLARLVPPLTASSRVDPSALSHDPAVIEAYRQDDLVHDRVSLRWFSSFLRERGFLSERLDEIRIPCLLLSPDADPLVDSAEGLAWFRRFSNAERVERTFAGAFHEVFNEPEAGPEALEALLQHLQTHRESRAAPVDIDATVYS